MKHSETLALSGVEVDSKPSKKAVVQPDLSATGIVESEEKTLPSERGPIAITVGDVSFDWYFFDLDNTETRGPRRIEPVAIHGGAWYIDNFLRIFLGPQENKCLFTYRRFPSHLLRACDARDILHTFTDYSRRPVDGRRQVVDGGNPNSESQTNQVFRVASEPRVFGPANGRRHRPSLKPCKLAEMDQSSKKERGYLADAEKGERGKASGASGFNLMKAAMEIPHPYPDDVSQKILIIHDSGHGFSSTEGDWSKLLPEHSQTSYSNAPPSPLKAIIYSLRDVGALVETKRCNQQVRAPRENKLWTHIVENEYLKRTVVIISANDLRQAGVMISKSVSWERTAYDVVSQLRTNAVLRELAAAGHLIIRFGISGLIHHVGSEQSCFLYYDPEHIEGEYRLEHEGYMFGFNGILAAAVAAGLYKRLKARGDELPKNANGRLEQFDPPEVTARALQAALESNLKTALASCRAYFRNGFFADKDELRQRLEEWDHMEELDIKKITGPGSPLKHTEVAIYLEKGEDEPHDSVPDRTLSLTLQFDVAENSIGQHLCFPEKVVNDLASALKDRLEEWHKSSPTASDTTIKVEVKHFPHRRGKAKLHVLLGLRARTDTESETWTKLADIVQGWFKCLTDEEFSSQINDETADRGERARARALARAWLDIICDEVSAQIHWRYGWPVCIRCFSDGVSEIARVRVENDPEWSILNPKLQNLKEIALEIVQSGLKAALRAHSANGEGAEECRNSDGRFPCARFGNLTTVDRKEIESYRSIRNLIREYVGKPPNAKPLSLAVFGPPGSGKSFGVKEIAKSVSSVQHPVQDKEFNLSQFTSPRDLASALIQVRDIALEGIVPLVFLDEFDATLDREQLGWLRYFLSIMQDGKFRSEAGETSVGRAILVFAGGTSTSYREFTRKDAPESKKEEFRLAKGPDFVSRLRGFVDIIGPDRRPNTNDEVYKVRRAITLRGLLEKNYKQLSKTDGPLDDDLANALLTISGYEHGTRSLEAILQMSSLGKARRMEKSALPPKDQLYMHLSVDPRRPNEFFDILEPTFESHPERKEGK